MWHQRNSLILSRKISRSSHAHEDNLVDKLLPCNMLEVKQRAGWESTDHLLMESLHLLHPRLRQLDGPAAAKLH